MDEESTPVLIVGAGLAGLSAALFLAWHGVPALVVERYPAALRHPRARAFTPRTVELFRGLGMERDLLAARTYVDPPDAVIIQAETLSGPEHARRPMAPPQGAAGAGDVTPCPWTPIDQDRLEALLSDRARRMGAEVRFGTALTGFSMDDGGVTAVVRDTGSGGEHTVRADYLLACDGHRSGIRDRLGVGSHGPGTLGHTISLVFRADLSGPMRGRPVGLAHLTRPSPGTVLLPHDGRGSWVFSVPYDPGRGESPAGFTPERCAELVRAAVGVPGLPVELVPQLADGTTVLGYEIGARVAERFRAGRAFLVGDSAHAVPPTGALGASLGMQDAHNLAWKLAAVLDGRAGAELLDGYEAERRPVAELTLAQSMAEFRERTARHVPEGVTAAAPGYYATIFGYRYGQPEPVALPPDRLTGQPGTRAPHVVLRRDGAEISTIDLFGRTFVLLAGPAWGGATPDRPDLVVHRIEDVTGRWAQAYGVPPTAAVLVRPDGFVAWRSSDQPDQDVERVLDRLLCRARSAR
jgi:putative polyketide hydroxylase